MKEVNGDSSSQFIVARDAAGRDRKIATTTVILLPFPVFLFGAVVRSNL
jgi:hypothetical protein